MIKALNISHFYGREQVLFNLSFEVESGELLFLSGESGSGKSTLLSILSTLLTPSSGELFFDDKNIATVKDMDSFRQREIGFIFQFHYLISYLNIYENIALGALKDYKQEIMPLLEKLGIANLSHRYPNELSGGQRQRAAVARALINQPKVIFADEPTGSLDSKNSAIIYELLSQATKNGTTVIVASHDMSICDYATKTIGMLDGKIL